MNGRQRNDKNAQIWEIKTTRIMNATVGHVTALAGSTKYQAACFLLNRVYIAPFFLFVLFHVSTGLATSQSIIHEDLPNNRQHDSEPRKTGNTRPHLPVNLKMQKGRSTNIPRTLHVPRTCR
jgi:hypothetical protein